MAWAAPFPAGPVEGPLEPPLWAVGWEWLTHWRTRASISPYIRGGAQRVKVPTLCGWGPRAVVPGLGQAGGCSRVLMGRCDGGQRVRGVLRLLDPWVTS